MKCLVKKGSSVASLIKLVLLMSVHLAHRLLFAMVFVVLRVPKSAYRVYVHHRHDADSLKLRLRIIEPKCPDSSASLGV